MRSLATTTAGVVTSAAERTRIRPAALACQVACSVGATGDPGQHQQVVGVGIPQREQIIRRGQDHVDRIDRQISRGPSGGAGDTCADVAIMNIDTAGDQRKEPLGIGMPAYQRQVVTQLSL